MKFNLTIEVEVDQMKFLKALDNAEFCSFNQDMETIEDVIKQTIATDIDFNRNIRDYGIVTDAQINLRANGRINSYHMNCDPVD